MNTRTPWPYPLALLPAAPATPAARSISDEFLRGCITSGLLAALQNPGLKPRLDAHTGWVVGASGSAGFQGFSVHRRIRVARVRWLRGYHVSGEPTVLRDVVLGRPDG